MNVNIGIKENYQVHQCAIVEEMCDCGSKGNWLLTYKSDYTTYGKALCEKEVENILIQYDLEMYEQIFGEVEEA